MPDRERCMCPRWTGATTACSSLIRSAAPTSPMSGKRTTGNAAGDFLLCGPDWKGDLPTGMTRIDVPHRSALLIGRVFAADEGDRLAAYELAKQIQLAPLNNRA